jgi:hypothetical protein
MNKNVNSNTQKKFIGIGIVLIILVHIIVFMMARSFIDTPVFKFFWSFKDIFISSIIAVTAAIFGPIVGLLMSFVDSFTRLFYIIPTRNYIQFYINRFFKGDALIFLLYGVSIGAFWKYFNITIKKLTIRTIIIYNIVQMVSSILFRYILNDIFVYSEVIKNKLMMSIRDTIIISLLSTAMIYFYSNYFGKIKNNESSVANMQD